MQKFICGLNSVLEMLRADASSIKSILIDEAASGSKIRAIRTEATKKAVRLEYVSKTDLLNITKDAKTQGVVAYVSPYTYSTIDKILRRSQETKEAPLLVLLDGITDPHNFGAILRAADGAGVHGVIVPKRRSVGFNATVAKVSAGASAHVLTAQVSNLNYTIDELKRNNIWIVGGDETAASTYYEADFTGPLGLVIGSEGKGLHRLVKEKCDYLVRIPMFGKVNSLNASVSTALLLYEARRQRRLKKASEF
ncbi:MAG: 23S rRNA (guanosine(2251)-2'-O)-methyltransferase RlmB [bacterium]